MLFPGSCKQTRFETCWFCGQPWLGGCGCRMELHFSAFGKLSASEPTHQPPRGVQGSAETHQALTSWGQSNCREGTGWGVAAPCAGQGASSWYIPLLSTGL